MNNFGDSKRILLAENDANDIELTMMALAEYNLGNEVVVVRDGAEALDYLYRRGVYEKRPLGNPVVMLLDLKMPKVGGLEVLRQVKEDLALKTMPIVVLTSSNQDQDIIKSYTLGVNAYVVKPVIFQNFIEVVKQLGLFWILTNQSIPRE